MINKDTGVNTQNNENMQYGKFVQSRYCFLYGSLLYTSLDMAVNKMIRHNMLKLDNYYCIDAQEEQDLENSILSYHGNAISMTQYQKHIGFVLGSE